jgi:serine/threonine protein kinase
MNNSAESLKTLGRYHILKKLASGGMAEIFLAKLYGEAGFEKDIAIKKILPQWSSDRDFVAMLIDEAKIAVQLTHPNIVQVYELAREDGVYFIAMEYIAGLDARRLMQKAHQKKIKIPAEVALTIVTEALEGLAFAHTKVGASGKRLDIIHRDISPQNILLSWDGMVKVTDFGIAKATTRSQETAIGVLKGKFAYMSPEQANQGKMDARSDVFAAAVVCYELLTCERLFYRTSDIETLDLVRHGKAEFSETAQSLISPALSSILMKALSPAPGDRFQSAAEFRKEILKFARDQGMVLSREAVLDFLKNLFEDAEDSVKPASLLSGQPTRTAYQTVSIKQEALEPTRALEVFAENTKTLFLPSETEKKLQKEATENFYVSSDRTKITSVIALGLFLAIVLWGGSHFFRPTPKPFQKIPTTVLPERHARDARPKPPEVVTSVPPVAARQVLAAPPATLPETRPETVPVAVTALPAVAKPIEAKKQEPVVKEGVGYLSVQAVPWGKVSVDGSGARETPVRRLSLKSGGHTVRVFYAPTNASVSAKIQIEPKREIVCIADFNRGKNLKCGK